MSAGEIMLSCAMSPTLYVLSPEARHNGLFKRSVVMMHRKAKPIQNFCPSDKALNGRDNTPHIALRHRVGGGVRSCMRLLTWFFYGKHGKNVAYVHSPAAMTLKVPIRAAICSTRGLSVSRALAEIATHSTPLSRAIWRRSVSISSVGTRSALLRTMICGMEL